MMNIDLLKQLPKFCVGGVPSSGTTWVRVWRARVVSPCSFVTNSIVPNNRPSAESRVSHGAGVKNAGSFRPCTTQYAQTVRGREEGRLLARGQNAAARRNEKSDDERTLLFVSSHIFDCRFRNHFVTRVYIAVLTSFSPIRKRGLINTILPGLLFIRKCVFHSFGGNIICNPFHRNSSYPRAIHSFLSINLASCILFVASAKL